MTRREFEKVVEAAVAALPEMFRKKIQNVEFRVAESPNRRQSGRKDPRRREPSLYGLYEGTPYGDRGSHDSLRLPDQITIFRRAIERDCKSRAEMVQCIQETVLHEIGHYFGLDDDRLDELGIG
jgi:predicted Zn-dependent protease with MMP-like domain